MALLINQHRIFLLGLASAGVGVLTAQEVGIGTTTPAARLHIHAPMTYTNDLFQVVCGAFPTFVIQRDGKTGIGTSTPMARLHIANDGMIYAEGDYGTGDTVADGPKVAFIWNPRKAALRAGRATGNEWDWDHIGAYSTAIGYNPHASGHYSVVGGGYANAATGVGSAVSGGWNNAASGHYSTIGGGGSLSATGNYSTVGGGNSNTASGHYSSVAGGYSNTASGDYSFAVGVGLYARSYGEMVIGTYNTDYTPTQSTSWNASDRLFVVGNGWSSYARSDALVILKNGNVGIGTAIPARKLHVSNAIRLAPLSSPPSSPAIGDIYMDDGTNTSDGTPKLRVYDGTTWRECW